MDKENVGHNEANSKIENVCFTVSEQTDHFIKNFNRGKHDLATNLLQAEQLEMKDKLPAHLDYINEEFQKLQRYVADASPYLPFYNLRVAQETLKHLQEQIFSTQSKVIPKKKFAFKNKKVQSSTKDLVDGAKAIHRKDLHIDLYECGFKNVQNEVLEKLPEEVDMKDVGLHALSSCTVRIIGSANTVHLSQLKDCKIFLGPVSTSVFVENCQECVFVVACQQLRVHSTTDCQIYLHVTCKAIVEDCSKLCFAPYNWKYDGIESHFKMSGLDLLRNNWNDVDDFNWLASVPSPNWSVMEESDRVENWND